MKAITQKQWIKTMLIKNGFITRNQCLRNGISRLSARIYDIRNEGWNIEARKIDLGKDRWDYMYVLKK